MGLSTGHPSPPSLETSPSFSPLSSAPTSPLETPLEVKSLAAHDRQIDSIIFDLGDVLFTWSVGSDCPVPSQTLHSMLRSHNWFEYEKGNLTEEEICNLAAAEFSLDASEIDTAFRKARKSFKSNPFMFTLLHELKENNDIRLFAMSNISAPDWEDLRRKGDQADWALFQRVFTSAEARKRKPDLGFFHYVLESTGVDPHRTAFVDDKLENVITAQSLGFKGILFMSEEEVARELRALVRNPIADGERYLSHNAKQMKSVTSTGVVFEENLSQLLILDATGDPGLVDYIKYPRLSNFFKSEGVFSTAYHPCDIDTTSIACMVSDHFLPEMKHDIMNEILAFKNKDGIILTYFDVKRPRIDPVVCINVLTFFHANGRGNELRETFNWVYEVLRHRAYIKGTLYYYGPDTFLYFLSRFLSVSIYARQRLGKLFSKRIAEHFGAEGDALALAMRIHAATVVDLCDSRDYEKLRKMQDTDGSWPMGWMYKFGKTGVLIGNKGLTTALALSAMRNYKELECRLRSFD